MNNFQLADFWSIPPNRREAILLDAIAEAHAWHYPRNRAYRDTLSARGLGASLDLTQGAAHTLPRLLRPTAQTFKSYIDRLDTPFAQDCPHAFLEWLADQLSIELDAERQSRFQLRYRSLEALLSAVEQAWADQGFELLTSSGTSGRASILVRDRAATQRTVDSFYLSFCRYLGLAAVQRAIFVMPRQSRIAMARMAGFSVERLNLPDDQIHFTIPFPADPDRVRVRTGRLFRPGWAGVVERRWMYPFMGWMQDHYVTPRTVRATLELLFQAEATGERVMLFAGWVQLHAIAQALQGQGRRLRLTPGSLLGTGGGLKEIYPFTLDQIRADLSAAVELADGAPVPIRDVYGMAEANWAAMQCGQGHYHLPPWVYARALDEDDNLQEDADATGLLAFFDPYGGGDLFPAFFKTADQVRLIRPNETNVDLRCPCGEPGDYLAQGSLQRVDLMDEAGCAAQV